MSANSPTKSEAEIQAAKNVATVVYALQAAGFAIGITFFVAPLLIYARRHVAAGAWVESHLRWQLNTFWFGVAGAVIGGLTLHTLIGLMVILATTMWILFRIIQGWSRLSRGQDMLNVRL